MRSRASGMDAWASRYLATSSRSSTARLMSSGLTSLKTIAEPKRRAGLLNGHMLRRILAVFLLVAAGSVLVADQAVPATLSGVVRWEEKPQSGITVSAIPSGRTNPAGTATTGADGIYKLTL